MNNIVPVDEEHIYEGSVIVSQTDLNGDIVYVNKMFCSMSGYSREELIGKAHNIIRHPDMPQAIFAKLWNKISSGQVWNGLIKNLRKDGLYYWVDIEILPIKDNHNELTGYMAVMKPASRKNILENEEIYSAMLEAEQ